MKTYQEFILEDFNSPKATQIKIPILDRKSKSGKFDSTVETLTFFESVPKRSFNLIRYLRSFDSENAKDVLANSFGFWRGLIFNSGQNLLVFVWKGTILHHSVCNALDQVASKDKVPKYKYIKTYNTMALIDPGETIGNEWCFPIVYHSGLLRTNLSDAALTELVNQKDIKGLFQLDSSQIADLTKPDM